MAHNGRMGGPGEARVAPDKTDLGHPRLYDAVGGMDGCRRLSIAFYTRVPRDPVLRPFFPSTFRCPIEGLSLFLAQFLGGPLDYSLQRRWWLSLHESHQRFEIGQAERDAWIRCMRLALDDVGVEPPARDALVWFFERSSSFMVSRSDALPIEDRDGTRADGMRREIAGRWETMRAVEEVVAAVHRGDTAQALELAASPTLQGYFDHDRPAYVSLLVLMIGSGNQALADYAYRRVREDPTLIHEPYIYSRTLLHGAAAAGDLTMVELLLGVGADPNVTDSRGQSPLYTAGNECSAPGGGPIVRALARAGADVNAADLGQRCTPLHMAARRGNVEIAAALLDYGADVEARDRKGDTPLRRAVNTGHTEVAALLLARGADRDTQGSKGLTPEQAARTPAMKQLLRSHSA